MPQDGGVKRRLVLPLVAAGVCALAVAAVVVQGLSSPVAAVRPAAPREEEISSYLQTTLDATWQNTRLADDHEQPETAAAQPLSSDEWSTAFYDCMTDAGFEVEGFGWSMGGGYELFTPDGGYVEDEDEQFAFYGCIASNPKDPISSGELVSPEQIQYTYDYFERWTFPCLAAAGIELTDPYNREAFVQDGGNGSWSPYFASPLMANEEGFNRLTALCGPATPVR